MSISQEINNITKGLPSTCKLVAVSKFHSPEEIMEAYNSGQRLFGENRPQELAEKVKVLPSDIEWHFRGHLQSNKRKMVVPYATLIHSIDTPKLFDEVNRYSEKVGKVSRCLLEVFIAKEESKHGFLPDEVSAFLEKVAQERPKGIEICGLMGMATFTDDTNEIEREFKLLKQLFDDMRDRYAASFHSFNELSMGMSEDYPIAIENGSTLIRVGTKIFGPRVYK